MSQNQSNKITDTSIDIDPVGVVYTLDADTISGAITEYLASKGITGGSVVLDVKYDDRLSMNVVSAYLFFPKGNAAIEQGRSNVPQHMRHRFASGGFQSSSKLTGAVRPIMYRKDDKAQYPEVQFVQGLYAIQLDIFRVVAMLLNADPNLHQLLITEANVVKGRVVMTVYKNRKFVDRIAPANNAQFEQALRKLHSR